MTDTRKIAFEGIDPNLKVLDEGADAARWEDLNKKAEALTKNTYTIWKEELQNLLIFAGLFSAIVTAFTIEAARTIQGDPADMTVLLLQTIVSQLYNQSNPQANLPINLRPEITLSRYAQHINLLYSVSLALSLVVVVGGIVCLQWLREFSRNITSMSNKEDLMLQQQRHESLQRWGVITILNMLPLLLLTALGLFFGGFTYSQLESKSLASGPVASLVIISSVFIICTTVLPTCQFLFLIGKSPSPSEDNQALPRPVLCPYRSPQSWLFHLIVQKLFLIANLPLLKMKSDFWSTLKGISSWMDYDTNGVKRWKEKSGAVETINQSLLWISREHRQATTVALDAYSCMVFASCHGTRMKLKNGDTPTNLKWNWEEQELLTSFEQENDINNTEIIRKIRAKAVVDATVEWNKSAISFNRPAPLSDILALEKFIGNMDRDSRRVLLQDIAIGLRSPETTWVTPENAVAVACHVIDQDSWHWNVTVPILEELCKRPTTRSLPHICHLCNKLRDKFSSDRKCQYLVIIFNDVFPSVDSAHYKDLVPILERLLVKCDKCLIDPIIAERFLKLIEVLASRRLIGKEWWFSNIFLYTQHILQRSWEISNILPSIETTLNALLSAAEEHAQHSPSEYSVLHPNRFTIQCTLPDPDYNEDLQSVWAVIDNFNMRLKEVWGIHEVVESGGERSRRIECISTSNLHSQIISAIHLATTPSLSTPLQSNKYHETATTLGVGAPNPVSPVLSSQDFEQHSSNSVSVVPARSEIPPATNRIATSTSSQPTSPLSNETSTSHDSHVITPSSQSDSVGLGTINQALPSPSVRDQQDTSSTPSLSTQYHAEELTGPQA